MTNILLTQPILTISLARIEGLKSDFKPPKKIPLFVVQALGIGGNAAGFELISNKVTSFSSPTDIQYPSAKLVSDSLALKEPSGAAAAAQAAAIAAAAVDATTKANNAISTASADATTKANAAIVTANTYADGLVVGLLDDRGNYNASSNVFPSSGGSGSAGAILKGDLWSISVGGTLGGVVVTVGDVLRALTNAPGQTAANWVITENNFGYVAENSTNKVVAFSAPTDAQYPSAKLVKDSLDVKAALAHTHPPSDITQGGATTNQALVWNGTAWAPATISASPGGSSGQVQYNNAGAFGGLPGVTYGSNTMLHVSQAAAAIPLAIQAATSQTGNLTEWRNTVGTMITRVASTGLVEVTKNGDTAITIFDANTGLGRHGSIGGLNIFGGSGATDNAGDANFGTSKFSLKSTYNIVWTASSVGASAQTGWCQKVAGVTEANNGTRGSYAGSAFGAGSQTVAQLPAASTCEGAHAMVTDATQTLTAGIGATVVGGGANRVPVVSNGTNWLIG